MGRGYYQKLLLLTIQLRSGEVRAKYIYNILTSQNLREKKGESKTFENVCS